MGIPGKRERSLDSPEENLRKYRYGSKFDHNSSLVPCGVLVVLFFEWCPSHNEA